MAFGLDNVGFALHATEVEGGGEAVFTVECRCLARWGVVVVESGVEGWRLDMMVTTKG